MDTLTVNSKKHSWSEGMTVSSLLAEALGPAATVVVEVNGEIVRCEHFGDTLLNKGDMVEIVHFVGGG